jgi:hypothetical protein
VRALVLAAAAVVAAACGSESATQEAATVTADPPAVAELACNGGPNLLTPVVRGRADGVHIRVRNETTHEAWLDYEVTQGATGGGGSIAPPGTSQHVIPFAAEEISLGCSPEALDRVELRVVDPGDELRSAELDCTDYRRDPPLPPKALKRGNPVAVARLFLRGRGLRPTDVVERAVSIAGEFPKVRVVRKGRVVAAVWFDDPEARHRIGTVEMCADFAE